MTMAPESSKGSMTLAGQVNFVVALRPEAQPVIEYFNMSPVCSGEGPGRFANSLRGLTLILSGIGRTNAAAAVSHLARARNCEAWVNLGIAGHRNLPLGEARIAHKVHCATTGRSWYPPLVFEVPCPTATVQTVDHATRDFPTDDLYDMEASGFYETATHFAPHELIHSFKVVSDNTIRSADTLTPDLISRLIGDNLETLNALIEPLQQFSAELCRRRVEPEELCQLLHACHFTITQRRQLQRLLRRWSVVCSQVNVVDWVESNGLTNANTVIESITEHLEGVAPTFETAP